MARTKLTQKRLINIYDKPNKKPKTLMSENKLPVIYDRVNGPTVKFRKRTVNLSR